MGDKGYFSGAMAAIGIFIGIITVFFKIVINAMLASFLLIWYFIYNFMYDYFENLFSDWKYYLIVSLILTIIFFIVIVIVKFVRIPVVTFIGGWLGYQFYIKIASMKPEILASAVSHYLILLICTLGLALYYLYYAATWELGEYSQPEN